MKRLGIIIAAAIAAGILIIMAVGMYKFNILNDDVIIVPSQPDNIKDATYVINHQAVTLHGGMTEETVEGSATKIVTRYFGNEVSGDFNNDGLQDIAFLLTQETGGSGLFYYLVAGLKTPAGYQGSNALLIGDRINPQTTGFAQGQIVVNYGDRLPGEPMTALPTAVSADIFGLKVLF